MNREIKDLLYRIRSGKVTTHKVILTGCYDVEKCEQEMIDRFELPRLLLELAEGLGLIRAERKTSDRYEYSEWSLTNLGWETILKEDNGTDNT